MIEIYKTTNERLITGSYSDEDIWISVTNPTPEEINEVLLNVPVLEDFLLAALDPEEVSRIEKDEDQVLILTNASINEVDKNQENNHLKYTTIPVGIIILNKIIISVTLDKLICIESFKNVRQRSVDTSKKTRFTLQIIYQMAAQYLVDLRKIDRYTNKLEKDMLLNLKNDSIIQLLDLEKNLVYFSNSLKGNENVVKKISRSNFVKKFEEDEDILEDTLIEMQQAREMATINSVIIRSIRDAFASVISNNLNFVMKFLASITIILTISTMVFSYFGMNTKFGMIGENPISSIVILIVTLIITFIAYIVMRRNNLL